MDESNHRGKIYNVRTQKMSQRWIRGLVGSRAWLLICFSHARLHTRRMVIVLANRFPRELLLNINMLLECDPFNAACELLCWLNQPGRACAGGRANARVDGRVVSPWNEQRFHHISSKFSFFFGKVMQLWRLGRRSVHPYSVSPASFVSAWLTTLFTHPMVL